MNFRRLPDESVAVEETRLSSISDFGFRISDLDRKSTRLNSSHSQISYAVFCLKKKNVCSHAVLSPVLESGRVYHSPILVSSAPLPQTLSILPYPRRLARPIFSRPAVQPARPATLSDESVSQTIHNG